MKYNEYEIEYSITLFDEKGQDILENREALLIR